MVLEVHSSGSGEEAAGAAGNWILPEGANALTALFNLVSSGALGRGDGGEEPDGQTVLCGPGLWKRPAGPHTDQRRGEAQALEFRKRLIRLSHTKFCVFKVSRLLENLLFAENFSLKKL